MKIKIAVILIISILLLSGCSNFNFLNFNINNPEKGNAVKNTTTYSFREELTIYKLSSDTFDNLLESNSFEDIKNVSAEHFNYPQDGNNYITYSVTVFEITNKFVELVNSKTLWEDYFTEDNADEKIENLVIFEAPYVPISVWIKTNINTYFLTIADENICNLYSQSDYIEQYKSHQFALKINSVSASNSKSVKTYYQHAELPLLEILSCCGASIKWKNDNQVNITLNKETYLLDVEKITLTRNIIKRIIFFQIVLAAVHTVCIYLMESIMLTVIHYNMLCSN